jgi:hypothetical protein
MTKMAFLSLSEVLIVSLSTYVAVSCSAREIIFWSIIQILNVLVAIFVMLLF